MNDVTVIVDVRVGVDLPDLVVVRQKLAMVDGNLRLVGDPVEEKMPLTVRGAEIALSHSVDPQLGFTLVARIQNVGMVSLSVNRVELEYRRHGACSGRAIPATSPTSPIVCGSFEFLPRDRQTSGVLLPGESRDWVLPLDYFGNVSQEVSRLAPDDYKIVAYAGAEPIAEAPGKSIEPHLDSSVERYGGSWGLRLSPPMHNKLLGMDAEIRQRILDAVRPLQERPTEEWASAPGLTAVEGGLFFLAVPPDYLVLLRRLKPGAVEIIDVLRRPELTGTVAAGAAG